MKIIRARLKPYGGSSEFISTKGRIKSLIEKNKDPLVKLLSNARLYLKPALSPLSSISL